MTQGSRVPDAPDAGREIDLRHLARYTLGNRALEAEVLALFAAQLPHTIAALRAAQCEKAWRVAAHTLKGSARAVGAWRLAELAQEAEHAPEVGAAVEQKVVAAIEAAAGEAQRFIAALAAEAARE
jgi:HPt (histidine-containing phosphotransfer) domain-containing protein